MPDVSFDNLLIICVIAVLAPLLAAAVPRLRIPAVVVEIVAGIVVGPTGFGWVRSTRRCRSSRWSALHSCCSSPASRSI